VERDDVDIIFRIFARISELQISSPYHRCSAPPLRSRDLANLTKGSVVVAPLSSLGLHLEVRCYNQRTSSSLHVGTATTVLIIIRPYYRP
jgi:hypothetical protein